MLGFSSLGDAGNPRFSVLDGVPGVLARAVGVLPDSDLEAALSWVDSTLEADILRLERETFIFAEDADAESLNAQNVRALCRWRGEGGMPGLAALCLLACERFGIDAPELVRSVMVASVLGEIPRNLSYHCNEHFRKVLLQVVRTVFVHNRIYGGTPRALDKRQTALLLIAACIHDFGHDGLGNTVRGVFEPGRLERLSFELARPYLVAAGLDDEADLSALEVMLLATDVSPLGDPTSPMRQMKVAYRFHFLGERRGESLNLSRDLARLEKDAALAQMALILHESDVATSAGLDYSLSQYETSLYRLEIGGCAACPSHILDFLEQVCQRQFLGAAAQKLYSANMARIYALAEQDAAAGNAPYALTLEGETSRTVN